MTYKEFIDSKLLAKTNNVLNIDESELNNTLFDYQKDLVVWALKLGKSAIFADTGLGKTFMQLEWSRIINEKKNKPVLIVAPLAVTSQTQEEALKLNLHIKYVQEQSECINGINITTYERLDKFESDYFIGIVLDESSILKSFSGVYKKLLIDNFKNTEFKLACSATPAPNDYMELGNHSEFLNVMNLTEMLSMFFVHDGGDTSHWRLKGHAVERFWEWVSSWSAIIKNPSDLGYDGEKHKLPELIENDIIIQCDNYNNDMLFSMPANTLDESSLVQKNSFKGRINKNVESVKSNPDEQWLIWCNYNDEANELKKLLSESVNVQGSDEPETKAKNLLSFGKGEIKYLITKPKIASFGLNWQSCHNIIFCSLNDSYEQYYQSIRRCYRFGQKNKVNVYRVLSYDEINILDNIERKHNEFQYMQKKMSIYTKKYVRENLQVKFKEMDKSYNPQIEIKLPEWLVSEE